MTRLVTIKKSYSMDVSHSVYTIYMWHKVSFLNEQNKFNLYTSFCQVIHSGFLRCEGKCSSQQQVGIMLEIFILNEIIY